MEYIDVTWIHSFNEEPVRLVSELDAQRFECRKLEFFRDGTVDFADINHEASRTKLGTAAIPPLFEINSDKQFKGISIGAREFETLWIIHSKTN